MRVRKGTRPDAVGAADKTKSAQAVGVSFERLDFRKEMHWFKRPSSLEVGAIRARGGGGGCDGRASPGE
jgi:hypothetical protein